MISCWMTIRLFGICAFISFITNFPAAVPSSSLNTAVHELRRFIHSSYAKRDIHLSDQTELIIRTVILNSWFISQFIGAVSLFSLAERLGRLGAFKLSVAAMGVGNLLQFIASFTSLPELFFCGRFLAGIFSPLADTCMVMFFQECVPIHLRGTFSFLGAIGYGSSTALGMLFGTKFMFGHSLFLLTGIQLPILVASFLFILQLPDTPKFLIIVKQDQKAAIKSLNYFQGKKDENVDLLKQYANMESDTQNVNNEQPASLREIISIPHVRFTMLIVLTEFILVLPFFAILQASTFMFENIGIQPHIAEFSSMVIFLTYTIACVVGTFIIERFPRRTLILFTGSLSCVFLSLFVIFSSLIRYCEWVKYASLVAILLFVMTFGMILGPISWFLSSELTTQRYRALIFSVCFGLLNLLITATNSICLLVFQQIGSLSFIPLFIVPYILAILFLWRYLVETKGRESYQVSEIIKLMLQDRVSAKEAERKWEVMQLAI